MGMGYKNLVLFLLCLAVLACQCGANAIKNREGFISLSCGANQSYTDAFNILWVPDDPYIETGSKSPVTFYDGDSMVETSLRYFPIPKPQYCYNIPLEIEAPILIRSTFIYKNYDGLNKPPVFRVFLGITAVAKVNLSTSDPIVEEFISAESKKQLSFCLLSTIGGGIPLISSLEIRPLPRNAYRRGTGVNSDKLLQKRFRINCGYSTGILRYPVDPYDRIWDVDENYTPKRLSAGFNLTAKRNHYQVDESPPDAVILSARVLVRKSSLSYNFEFKGKTRAFVIMYFSRILHLLSAFRVLVNEETIAHKYTIPRRDTGMIYIITDRTSSINITLQNISYHPQINALEIFQIADIPLGSSQSEVSALQAIQEVYHIDLGWENDPCSPVPWKGIQCDEDSNIISLDLSNLDLQGPITPAFGDLLELQNLDLHNNSLTGQLENVIGLSKLRTLNLSFNKLSSHIPDLSELVSLQTLDLQSNNLQGRVPENLGMLVHLKYLNLQNNQLLGPLPISLNRKTLDLRISGNLCLTFPGTSCFPAPPSLETPRVKEPNISRSEKHGKFIIITLVSTIAFVLIAGVVLIIWCKKRANIDYRRSLSRSEIRNWNIAKRFTFREIKQATNSFKETIGRGSFGSVYLGKLSDGKRVAVKVRFDPSQLAADSFINEVFLLSQIHHQNLVSLEGFCQESKHQILVYEYLPEGALTDHLYGSRAKRKTLDWRRRLKIAVDAAAGIEYLHNGTNPKIIHRDVKCSNILLDSDLNAKVCDFGLSKQIVQADATHVTTVVKGTAGYLDPEYYSTQQLTDKSDVYSFGVVLLELICGREPLTHTGSPDSYNLVLWAKPYLQAGDYNVIDKNLQNNYSNESMKRVSYIASKCVERDASQRPTMAEVLYELKSALAAELAENSAATETI